MPGRYLQAFFEDLEIKLAQWAGVNLDDEHQLGTIDQRIQQGENWDEDLSRGLKNDKVFVAILTPLYFNRPNCGKELGVFLLRMPGLGIDQNGALTGVRNVLLIRWMPENAYAVNTGKDSLIPPIIRLIEDTPADDGRDPDRTRAIERYRKKGMEMCVNVEPHYPELLNLFAARIRDLPELPPALEASFATAQDAFRYDWENHFTSAGARVTPSSTPAVDRVGPSALTSVVVFYVTRRPFARDPNAVNFADQLIAEALPGEPEPADPAFNALLADVRAAGVAERLTVFHAASNPVVPETPDPLLDRLISLSDSRVLTALVVDPNIWPGAGSDATTAIDSIIASNDWTGPVLLPSLGPGEVYEEGQSAQGRLPSRVIALPPEPEARMAALRRAFIDARGRVLRTSTDQAPHAEQMPMLKSVRPKDQ